MIHRAKASITITKSITSFEAGYSSKTTGQQLAVVMSGVGNFCTLSG